MFLARDVMIADLLGTLARPEDYVRGVLENLYACLSQRSGNQKGDLFVRIGVTGHGIVPHSRIDYFDEVDLSSKGLGNNSVACDGGRGEGPDLPSAFFNSLSYDLSCGGKER